MVSVQVKVLGTMQVDPHHLDPPHRCKHLALPRFVALLMLVEGARHTGNHVLFPIRPLLVEHSSNAVGAPVCVLRAWLRALEHQTWGKQGVLEACVT